MLKGQPKTRTLGPANPSSDCRHFDRAFSPWSWQPDFLLEPEAILRDRRRKRKAKNSQKSCPSTVRRHFDGALLPQNRQEDIQPLLKLEEVSRVRSEHTNLDTAKSSSNGRRKHNSPNTSPWHCLAPLRWVPFPPGSRAGYPGPA